MKFFLYALLFIFLVTPPLWGAKTGNEGYSKVVSLTSSSGSAYVETRKVEVSSAELPATSLSIKHPLLLRSMHVGKSLHRNTRTYLGLSAIFPLDVLGLWASVKLQPKYKAHSYGLLYREKLLFPVHYFL